MITKNTNIITLNIANCKFITDNAIRLFTNLIYLNCANTNLTDKSIICMGNIKKLNIENCKYITDYSLKHLIKLKILIKKLKY